MDPLDYEPVRQPLLSLPQIASWPEIATLFAPGTELPKQGLPHPTVRRQSGERRCGPCPAGGGGHRLPADDYRLGG